MQSLRALVSVLALSTVYACAAPPSDGMVQTLEAMESAVRNGDPGAYMALIDTHDPKFVSEQRAWIADLNLKPISMFSIEPVGEVSYGPSFALSTLSVRFQWVLEADKVERELTTRIKLVPLNTNDDGPWRFAGLAWEVMEHNPEVDLRVLSMSNNKELAQSVLEVVPSIQSKIEAHLDCALSEPLTIKIYPSMQELQFSIALGYLDPISGWNEPHESIKILARSSVSASHISSLLAHEIGHAVSFEFGEQIINAPWWSLEGIAELVADEYREVSDQSRELRVAKQVARGDRRSWEQLSDFKGEALNHTGYVYSHGWSMIRFITQHYGPHARNQWFAAMGQGASVEDATQSVLKVSFEDLDRMWEAEMISVAEQNLDD